MPRVALVLRLFKPAREGRAMTLLWRSLTIRSRRITSHLRAWSSLRDLPQTSSRASPVVAEGGLR